MPTLCVHGKEMNVHWSNTDKVSALQESVHLWPETVTHMHMHNMYETKKNTL